MSNGCQQTRLDVFLAGQNFGLSREKAKSLISEGYGYVNGRPVNKPSFNVSDTDHIEVKKLPEYVSRGGYKLKKALESFNISVTGKIALDIGASTGGFTDCLLQNGAEKVFAVDVGTSQLVSSLKEDKRVISIENTDIRKADFSSYSVSYFDIITADVSFISITAVLDDIKRFSNRDTDIVVLLKPQFEIKTRKGFVRLPSQHEKIISDTVNTCLLKEINVKGLDFSPIKGGDGNIEFLLYLSCDFTENHFDFTIISDVVNRAHQTLI